MEGQAFITSDNDTYKNNISRSQIQGKRPHQFASRYDITPLHIYYFCIIYIEEISQAKHLTTRNVTY